MSQTLHGEPAVRDATSDAVAPRRTARAVPALVGELAPVLVATVVFLALAVSADLPWTHGLRALLTVLVTQVLPGALLWRAVRPPRGWWLEDLTMGFALGSVVAVATQVVAGLSGQAWLSVALPLALGVVLIGLPGTRTRVLSARTTPLPWWFSSVSALASFAAVPQLLAYFRQVPLTWATGFRTPHVDAYFHLAVSAELAHRGPTTFPWVASEPLAYHWFSHAWVAQISQSAGVPLDETLFRFAPVLLPLVAALVVATAAVRLSGRAWAGPVAAVLTMAGGDFTVFGTVEPNRAVDPLSPSLGLSLPMLVALVVVLACRWRGQARSCAVLLIPLLAVGAAGTKGSALPLVVAGLGVAAGAMLVLDRSRVRRLSLDLLLVVGCLGFAVVVVFHGSGEGLHLAPLWLRDSPSNSTWVGQAVAVVSEVARRSARGAGILLLLGSARGRRDPLSWTLAGAGAAGTLAVVMFSHPGGSQGYFALNAIPLLAIGSALGLVVLVDALRQNAVAPVLVGLLAGPLVALAPTLLTGRLTRVHAVRHEAQLLAIAAVVLALAGAAGARSVGRRRGVALASAVAVALLSAGVAVVGHGLVRPAAPPRAVPITQDTPLAVSRGQVAAARWIRDHSGADDVVMTNRHCVGTTAPVHCDSRRFVVAAFSERQVLLEGWTNTPRATEVAPSGRSSIVVDYWEPDLLRLNDGFIARPTATAAARLRGLGVRWVMVDETRPHAPTLEPFARLRFRAQGVAVSELLPG